MNAKQRGVLFAILSGAALAVGANAQEETFSGKDMVIVVSNASQGVEHYAMEQLAAHVAKVAGVPPRVIPALEAEALFAEPAKVLIVLGIASSHAFYEKVVAMESPVVPAEEQGYVIWTGRTPESANGLCAGLLGHDGPGLLYAVRDFAHYVFYREKDTVCRNPLSIAFAP